MGLMTVHLFTGLAAVGYIPVAIVNSFSDWSAHIVSFFMSA
jgi:hypothetical protein